MMTSTTTASIRDIKIKSGVVKRLSKELDMYKEEARDQESRIEKLISSGADEYTIKKQREVLQESLNMIPETKKRLEASYEELRALMETDKSDSEQAKTALEILATVQPKIDSV